MEDADSLSVYIIRQLQTYSTQGNCTKWRIQPIIGSLRIKGNSNTEEGDRTSSLENRTVCGVSDIFIFGLRNRENMNIWRWQRIRGMHVRDESGKNEGNCLYHMK